MEWTDKPALGDKVKVKVPDDLELQKYVKNMERFIGREGKVDGAVTDFSCVVLLTKGGQRRWFDFRELEIIKRAGKK